MFLSGFFWSCLGKYQVCSITINSSDEIEMFKKNLSSDYFDFVELLPADSSQYAKYDSHWFHEACKQGYSCDILVVSGHFGGTFFGKSQFTLPTELLEEKSCNKSCSGVLSQVKEVFLFGCNTLARKAKDTRTYQEYLQVLLEDGMARETAERVVASRYSPLEAPFYKRMNFIFSGSSTVYGFDQLSPLGKHIRNPLDKYFKSINKSYGGYHQYLESEAYKRETNTELLNHLKHTTINQAYLPSLKPTQKDHALFQNKCQLYDEQAPLESKVNSLKNIFDSGNSGSAFFAIDHFLGQNESLLFDTKKGREVFHSIRTNPHFYKEFSSFYKHLNHLPYIKIVYLNILKKFQWIDPVDHRFAVKKDLLNLIQKPDSESYVSVFLLLSHEQLKARNFYFSKKELPEDYIQNIWSLLILEKLQAQVPHLEDKILDFCRKGEKALCYQALNTLAHISPKDATLKKAMPLLNQKDEGLILYTLRLLSQNKIPDYDIHEAVAYFLNHDSSWVRKEAFQSLLDLKTPYQSTQDQLAQVLFQTEDKERALSILKTFSRMNLKNPDTIDRLIKYINTYAQDEELFKAGIQALRSTRNITPLALDYFYWLLDDEGSTHQLYFILNQLAFMGIKDRAFYDRLVQYFHHEQAQVRQKVLRNVNSLTWFHEEAQSGLLNYLTDKSPEIRKEASQLLRNIQNITFKTWQEILAISEKYDNQEIKNLIQFLSDDKLY